MALLGSPQANPQVRMLAIQSVAGRAVVFPAVLVSFSMLAAYYSCNPARRQGVQQNSDDEDCRYPKDSKPHGLSHPATILSA